MYADDSVPEVGRPRNLKYLAAAIRKSFHLNYTYHAVYMYNKMLLFMQTQGEAILLLSICLHKYAEERVT